MNLILPPPDVPFLATDEEAERLWGPWARGLVSAVGRAFPPVAVFTVGTCSRCGSACTSQMVRMTVNAPGKAEALCTTCIGHDVEARQPDWFAAEERVGR